MFSTFPGGRPGVGLLLLRVALGGLLILQGALYFAGWHNLPWMGRMAGFVVLATGVLLLLGYMTPVAGFIAAASSMATAISWFSAPALELFDKNLTTVLAIVIALAIVCLGPGAFSLDARLFGRREIIIPDISRRRD
jgi:uncharacterized membrane protein YphA (DoxX/SURF4 family)